MRRHHMHSTPTWKDAHTTQRCSTCGRPQTPSSIDLASQLNDMIFRPVFEHWNRVLGGMLDPRMGATQSNWQQLPQPTWSHRDHSCGCHDCDCDNCLHDDCQCLCCIGDVDLIIYARLGEQRVVPLVIENSRRRERLIHLELSGWTTRGGRRAADIITASLQPVSEFTLRPCEEKEVVLLVHATAGTAGEREERRLPDVDDCEVYYAEIRVEGCDIRSIRIALALLPRDCDAFEIDCRCGCC